MKRTPRLMAIRDTRSRSDLGAALAALAGALELAVAVGIRVLAVGGIDLGRLFEVAATGAWGAAAIKLFESPASQAEIAAELARVRAAFAARGSAVHA